jgi:hypothetical protein
MPSMTGEAVTASLLATMCVILSPALTTVGALPLHLLVRTDRRGGPSIAARITHRLYLASGSGFPVAQDLDGRASEYGVAEPDVRLGNPHLHGFDRVMFVERACGDPLRQGLGKLHGRSLHDVARQAMDLAVVHCLREVVGGSCRPQVEAQLDANDERLAKLVLGLQGTVTAVKDHVSK